MDQLTEALQEARGWLSDCAAPGLNRMDDQGVALAVHTLYDGGWPEFLAADATLHIPTCWLLAVRRWGLKFANTIHPIKEA